MQVWDVTFDNNVLSLEVEDAAQFRSSAFYKISFRRYVSDWDSNVCICDTGLTYRGLKKVISVLEKGAAKQGVDLHIGQNLLDYIDARELYIEERSKLGVQLKHGDLDLDSEFQKFKSVVDEAMVRPLREKQMRDAFFMCTMKKAGNFSVPGSGKTASVLGEYAYLKHIELVKRIVVICPKNAFGSWIDEFQSTFGDKDPLNALNIHESGYQNINARKMALSLDSGKYNLILVNYESSSGIEDELVNLVKQNSLLVFDEVHRVKRIMGQRAQSALRIAKDAEFVVALTGTPIPNGYIDIYNFLNILFPDEYQDFFGFTTGQLKEPSNQDVEIINEKLQPFFCRTTKMDLDVPRANPDFITNITASSEQNQIFDILSKKYRNKPLLRFLRVLQLETNPKLLLERLDFSDFENVLTDEDNPEDIEYRDYSEDIKSLILKCQRTPKFEQCIELTRTIVGGGKTAIIWCIFKDSIHRISAELERLGIPVCTVYGEVPLEERLELIEDFRNGTYKVLITNPHTLGESVSLHSVCHDAIYYEYSYNLVHFLQSKDRIHRLGLPEGQYTQYYILEQHYLTNFGVYSMDEEVYSRLLDKEALMLNAIENDQLEILPTEEEDLDKIFRPLGLK